jgi:hypothetical protein
MARSPSEEPKATIADNQTDNQADELKRLDTILKISTELKSRELREKFRQMVMDGWRAKDRAKAQVWTFTLIIPWCGLLSPCSMRSFWKKRRQWMMQLTKLRENSRA